MISSKILWLLLSALLAAEKPVENRGLATGLLTRNVTVGSASYNYQLYIPDAIRTTPDLPVILFLHGIGQRGEGGFVPATGGVSTLAKNYLGQVPAIIVLPQCRKDRYWHDPDMEKMAVAAVDRTLEEFGGDKQRLYLAGVSMGGYGAWHMAAEYSGKFAAVVPICGGSPLRTPDRFAALARKIGQTPVWAFHGADDRVVPVSESRNMVKALKEEKGNVKYSEYPGVGHNVWMNALSEPGLMSWIMSQRLGK